MVFANSDQKTMKTMCFVRFFVPFDQKNNENHVFCNVFWNPDAESITKHMVLIFFMALENVMVCDTGVSVYCFWTWKWACPPNWLPSPVYLSCADSVYKKLAIQIGGMPMFYSVSAWVLHVNENLPLRLGASLFCIAFLNQFYIQRSACPPNWRALSFASPFYIGSV